MNREVQKIPFLRLTLALISGIIAGVFFHIPLIAGWLISICLLSFLLLIHRNYRYDYLILFGTMTCLLYFITGLSIYNSYNRKPVFYDHGFFLSTVMEIPVMKKNSVQTILKLHSVKNKNVSVRTDEKITVLFEKSKFSLKLEPGDRVVFKRAPRMVESSNNPFEFNYKNYLLRKRIYRQLYLRDGEWAAYSSESFFSPVVRAERIRLSLLGLLSQSGLAEKHQNILAALTLGYKGGLDPETRQTFASAGAIHVLAVSGLHVGIVFMALSICLGFLKINRSGKIILLFISISSLWFFALLTGLSPSVTRAALMLTFVIIGQNLRKRANIYNTLTASAFFLLILNPNNLFDAGFQFSYSAVFGIVFMQPRIEKLIEFKFLIIKYLWTLLSVSIAAQIATFPLSVYYFGQFPAYFWLSNLLIIPAVTIAVPLGFILLSFHWCPLIFHFLSLLTDKLFDVILGFLKIIEQMPCSVIQISMSETEIFFICSLLLSLFFLLKTMKVFYLKSMLFSFFMILGVSLVVKVKALCSNEIIVYNLREATVVHLIAWPRNYVISSKAINASDYSSEVVTQTVIKLKLDEPFFLTTGCNFKDGCICLKNNIVSFKGRIICLTGKNFHFPDNMQPDIIIGSLKNFSLKLVSPENVVTLVTKMRIKNNFPTNINVCYLEEKGAYREKW